MIDRDEHPRVAIEGVGVVGGRLARELVSTDRRTSLQLRVRSQSRRSALDEAFGVDVQVVDESASVPSSVELVVLAGAQDGQVSSATRHVGAGRHVVAVVDRPDVVAALLELDGPARERGVSVVVGAGFSPGLSGAMAARLASGLDSVEEVHYARHGAAGRLCAADRLRALRHEASVWHDGERVGRRAGTGRELCWFPDPIGGADAYFASTGEPLLAVAGFDSLQRCSARLVMSRWDRVAQHLPVLVPAPPEGGIGALRVEVRGHHRGECVTRVMGTLDRPGVAAAALASEVVLALLGGGVPTGSFGLESWPDPGELLVALHGRGIRMATPG